MIEQKPILTIQVDVVLDTNPEGVRGVGLKATCVLVDDGLELLVSQGYELNDSIFLKVFSTATKSLSNSMMKYVSPIFSEEG